MTLSDLALHKLITEYMNLGDAYFDDEFGATLDQVAHEAGNCSMVSNNLVDWLDKRKIQAKAISAAYALDPTWAKRAGVTPGSDEDAHTVVQVGQTIIDLTARQFDAKLPYPRFQTLAAFKREWETLL